MATTEAGGRGFVAGIVLAAGASTRMGRPKQLLPVAGRPLLQHVIDQASASCLAEVVVVLGSDADRVRRAVGPAASCPTRWVVNPDHGKGQSTSLRLGLQSTDARATAAAILLGDQPGVSAALIDTVVERFLAGDAPAARPVHLTAGGRRVPGHPVVLARRIWDSVERVRGDQGARQVLAAHPEWLLEVPVTGDPPADIDTWEDYQRALTRTVH